MDQKLYGAGLGLNSEGLQLRYPQRDATRSEQAFFLSNPSVAGYASPDSKVVMNPGFTGNADSVLFNERLRQLFRDQPDLVPGDMQVHQHQVPSDQYANDPIALRSTVLARLLAGDPSGSPYSAQQYEAAQRIYQYLESMK